MKIRHSNGFTVIELLVAVLFLVASGILVAMQLTSLASTDRDSQRKTAINAMYYSLENVFFKQNGYYPAKISSTNLTSVDPALFTDPNGAKLGDPDSDYRYDSTNCTNDKCLGYKLTAKLEKEAEYIKQSPTH